MKKRLIILISIGFILNSFSQITNAEYFIDTDPGAGSGIAIAISSGNTIDENFTLPTATLANGLHLLHIRTQGTNGVWSLYHRAYFSIQAPNNTLVASNIVEAEYFIDTDPGAGNATALTITNGMTVDQVVSLPIGTLPNGLHVLHMRVKDADNTWSLYHRAHFVVYQNDTNLNPTPIVDAEYFFDTDPGVGNGIAIPVTDSFNVDEIFSAAIPLTFADGDHYIHIRVIDQDGTWSLYKQKLVIVDASVAAVNEMTTDDNLMVLNFSENSIQTQMKNGTTIVDFKAYDILGKLRIHKKPNTSSFIENTSCKPGTVLIIKATLESGQVMTTKFIKH